MTQIRPITLAHGAIGAWVGGGAAMLAMPSVPDERRTLVRGLLVGAGGIAATGAVLARSTVASGPLAGLGAGLIAVGVADAVRASRVEGAAGPPPAVRPPEVGGGSPPRTDRAVLPGDLLPDGIQAAPTQLTLEDGRLRFDAVVGNIGAAPLQIALDLAAAGEPQQPTTQVVFNRDGTARERALTEKLRLDTRADHSHLHLDEFLYFQLYRADAAGRPDTAAGEVARGAKQSFFITDIQSVDGTSPANLRDAARLAQRGRVDRAAVAADVVQGISVGSADVYGPGVAGQSLDVGEITPGRYVLRQTFDAGDDILEQDERNNTADTLIEVSPEGSVRKVSSELTPVSQYVRTSDGRFVIPEVVTSLARNVYGDDHYADGHVDSGH